MFSYCAENDIALLPGVLTPTDVATSLQFGYKTMKLFPAGSMPRHYVKDLQGPFDGTNYMAIGGVSPANIREFFDAGCISVGLASSLMPKDAVAANDWGSLRRLRPRHGGPDPALNLNPLKPSAIQEKG